MSNPTTDVELLKTKRRLRLQIGRLRRRINGRVTGTQKEGRRLLSWRTYAARYPGGALASAFGVGMATSAGLKGPKLIHAICAMLVRRGTGAMLGGVRDELMNIWKESAPGANTEGGNWKAARQKANAAEVDDGR